MSQFNVIPAAFKIHYLTNLNTYLIDHSETFIFHHEFISMPAFMPGAKYKDIYDFYKEMKQQNNQLYTYVNSWGLYYLGYTFSLDNNYSVIIGPYLQLTLNLKNLTKKYQLEDNEREELSDFCNHIHLLSSEKSQSYASVLQLFEMMVVQVVSPLQIELDNDIGNKMDEQYHITEDVSTIVNLRYKIEADFLFAVEQGNKVKAVELLNSDNLLFSFSERFPNQPLRRVKNLVIVINTLLRTVAKKSNVPPILIHRLSEKYAVQIENKTRLVELQQLQDDMIEEYCELVVSNSLSNYSKITQEVIAYIMTYYRERIEIKELAALNFTHPSHLSRKFKQDTNMTITAYQQSIRMDQAKYLLRNDNMPIEEIAWIVGYEDSSYFARVFKQETGYTPTQYREVGGR